MSDSSKSITLTPDRSHFFWYYLFGVLLLPIGLGVILLWVAIRRQKSLKYIIKDRSISFHEGNYSQSLELFTIQHTSVQQSNFQKRLNIGDIVLKANASSITFEGLKNPKALLEKIDLAIETEQRRIAAEQAIKPRVVKSDPGAIDRVDYLIGLWQQGLISDEDYHEERKKFGKE